jgi:ketosteroid isomerase-like protein
VGEAENVELLRTSYERWNATGRPPLELLDPEIEWVNPLGTNQAVLHGPESVASNLHDVLESFEFMRHEPERIVGRGDLVVVVSRTTVRGKGSGVEFTNRAAHVWTVRDLRALRFEVYEDVEAALRLVDA